jgi:hypothetical protein
MQTEDDDICGNIAAGNTADEGRHIQESACVTSISRRIEEESGERNTKKR